VKISTAGYCKEIGERHDLHLPSLQMYETTGMSWCHFKVSPQVRQTDRPPSPIPELYLSPATLRKLPTTSPSMRQTPMKRAGEAASRESADI